MNVIEFIKDEVQRQGHNIDTLDGWQRTMYMLDAWTWAYQTYKSGEKFPEISSIITVASKVEPFKNKGGYRYMNVMVGGKDCPPWEEVPRLMNQLWSTGASVLPPDEFYKYFEEIHGFQDGNGRTGKVLYNWIRGTLSRPTLPPDFWGHGVP